MDPISMLESKRILKKYWGFDSFRPLQEDIIASVLEGNNTLALLPTGGGKSLCYQLPALALPGKTLVISPLIALMEDQVSGLQAKGVRAIAIHAGLNKREVDIAIDNWVHGKTKILFIAPERILTPIFFERLKRVDLSLLAVDESHCISQWGYDFRPSYFNIIEIKKLFPKVPVIALTATATDEVVDDVVEKLGIGKSQLFRKSFLRENLSISVLLKENKDATLLKILGKLSGSGIIYQRNRSQTQYIASLLAARGFDVTFYHGGLSHKERKQRQEDWMSGKKPLIVCTNAFGMGIDKADVRFVIHLDIPPSLEEYYQEIGRAGRDGEQAQVISILNKGDFAKAIYNHQTTYATLDEIGEVYHRLYSYLKIPTGSGEGESYPFDISAFFKLLDISVRTAWSILTLLEKEGFWSLSQGVKMSSKLMLLVTGPSLNEMLRDQNARLEVVHYMLRQYEGLFVEMTDIDEEDIAKKMGRTGHEIRTILTALHREGLLRYQKGNEEDTISFHKERLSKTNFTIDKKKFSLRKKRAVERLSSMIEFFNASTCRQVNVLNYFGEKALACGTCDNCLGATDVMYTQKDYEDLKTHLFKYLGKQEIFLDQYVYLWSYNRRAKIQNVIKILESEGALLIVDGQLKPKL